ncbi:MAG: D-aminoacylase [Acidimicrobiales bacterium]|nr:D-aminoacylase [Acidimicrobiales bacterium]
MASVDLVIRNARILDGTGAALREGDVAVVGGRINAVGAVGDVDAATTIDAAGAVLSPGFVDVHTHDDGALLRHPDLAFKLSQGCTSLVVGNCGFSAAPAVPGERDPSKLLGVTATWSDLTGYAAAVAGARPACNAVALVGHNTVRRLVLGLERRAPTAAELDRMRAEVRLAMAQGACGFSTGLIYEPGRYSETDELIVLAREAAEAGGLYATHLRNEGDRLLDAVEEALTIGREAGLPVQISHHKSAGARNWGKVGASLERIDRANAEGLDVTADVYPYTAGSGPMAQYFNLDRLDPDLAAVIRFASCPALRELEGRNCVDVAAEWAVPPTEVIRRVLTAERGADTICIQVIIDEADVETNLRHPRMMVGSDGIVDLGGRPHPRLFGTFPRVLGHYVRERNVLGLADAVRRMTSLSCDRFGLVDRGRVVEGAWADLVLFDDATIADRATYDEPKRESDGIRLVCVNGEIAYRDGAHTGVGAGRMLMFSPR